MIQNFTKITPIAFLVLVLLSSACQTSTIISTLENVVSAAEIAIPVIGAATGLNPATSAAIVSYLQQVNTATAQASTILAGAGSSAQKAAEIAKAFAGIAKGCNCVPAGTPQTIVSVVDAVAQAVIRFLTNFPANTPALTAAKPPTIKLSVADRIALTQIQTRAVQNQAKLQGVKK